MYNLVDMLDKTGYSLLQFGAYKNNLRIVEFLLTTAIGQLADQDPRTVEDKLKVWVN